MSAVLDVVLALVLLAALVQGSRAGFVRSIGGLAGVVAGVVAAALLAPRLGALVPDDTGRVAATVVAAVLLVLLGSAIGTGIGAAVGGVLRRGPLGAVDRVLGAVAQLVVAALAVSTVASLAVALGVPSLAQPVAGSVVLRSIDAATPAPLDRALARLRSTVLSSGIPRLGGALADPGGNGSVPATASTTALRRAAASVVKITGRAPACGQEQSGSGFAVARDRVLTNAHVVAGVTEPVVLSPDGRALKGEVTVFDPQRDLAVVAVRDLGVAPLAIAPEPEEGTTGVVAGYPFGGPFTQGGARVLRTGTVRVPDVQGGGTTPRAIASIAADVEQGNSGGPLLGTDGRVLGVVFAKSTDRDDLGYAMTRQEVASTVAAAPSASSPVATGACSRD